MVTLTGSQKERATDRAAYGEIRSLPGGSLIVAGIRAEHLRNTTRWWYGRGATQRGSGADAPSLGRRGEPTGYRPVFQLDVRRQVKKHDRVESS